MKKNKINILTIDPIFGMIKCIFDCGYTTNYMQDFLNLYSGFNKKIKNIICTFKIKAELLHLFNFMLVCLDNPQQSPHDSS